MTPCLQPDEFVDLLDGAPVAAARAAHAEQCPACRALLADLAAALREARAGDVPEPSPFFWASVNARVRAAVATTPVDGGAGRGGWLRWDTLVPITGVAVVLAVLVGAVDRVARPAIEVTAERAPIAVAAPNTGGDATAVDDALALVLELASSLPEGGDGLSLSPMPDLGATAAAALSDDEQQALAELLRAAVDRPKS